MMLANLYKKAGQERSAVTSYKEVLRQCPLALDAIIGKHKTPQTHCHTRSPQGFPPVCSCSLQVFFRSRSKEPRWLPWRWTSSRASPTWTGCPFGSKRMPSFTLGKTREPSTPFGEQGSSLPDSAYRASVCRPSLSFLSSLEKKSLLRDNVDLLVSLADVYFRAGDTKNAILKFEQAQMLDPYLIKGERAVLELGTVESRSRFQFWCFRPRNGCLWVLDGSWGTPGGRGSPGGTVV